MAGLPVCQPDPPELEDAEDVADVTLEPGGAVCFEAARLQRVEFGDGDYPNLALTDLELTDCDLANVQARGATLKRAHLEAARLVGWICTEAQLRHVTFAGCAADLASFGATRLDVVAFRDCRLRGADFSDASLRDVTFERCDLTGADFTGASCRGVTLRDCTLDALRGIKGLRGATLTRPDIVGLAVQLAAALGIAAFDP